MAKVLVVGTTEKSGGGITSVIRLIKKMPVWSDYQCCWLGTQVQARRLMKVYTLLKAYLTATVCLWRYNIIHFHTVPGYGVRLQLPIFLLAKLLRKKTIIHLHIGNQLERERELNDRVFRWCIANADMILLLANRFKDLLKKNYPEVSCPVEVVYNACEEVKDVPYSDHKHTILFAGIFDYNKAGDILIKAFAMVHDKFPDWRLQMLGSGPWEDKYRNIAEEYKVVDYVDFPGYIGGETKAAYFRTAGIYAMCSYLEGFPMVVLEAWAYGVPVISTPVGGMPDVIIEEKTACEFDFGNVEELAVKLNRLMSDESLRQTMSIYGKKTVNDYFSMEAINNQLERIYSNLCQN